MSKLYYNHFENKAKKTATIHIFGEIGRDRSWWDGTNNKSFPIVKLIKRLEKSNDTIKVVINSPGGNITEGLAIYNTLKASTADIQPQNIGFAGSMAGILMCSGTSSMPKSAVHHIHRASGGMYGNVSDFEDGIRALEVHEAACVSIMAEKTGLSEEEIRTKWMDGREHYLTAQEAKDIGLIDIIEEDTGTKSPSNIADLKQMKYADIRNMFEQDPSEEKGNFFSKMKDLFLNTNPQNAIQNNNTQENLTPNTTIMSQFKSPKLLLGILAMQSGFEMTDGQASLTADQLLTIENKLAEIENIKAKAQADAEAHAEAVTAFETKIAEMQAVIDGTQVSDTPPVGGDNGGGGPNKFKRGSKEAVQALKEHNEKFNIK